MLTQPVIWQRIASGYASQTFLEAYYNGRRYLIWGQLFDRRNRAQVQLECVNHLDNPRLYTWVGVPDEYETQLTYAQELFLTFLMEQAL